MSASLTIDTSGLKLLIARLEDPSIKAQLEQLPQEKGIAALVGQAIADNFEKEGPGWEALKPATIRRSVAKNMRKRFAKMTDEEIEKHEALVRKQGMRDDKKNGAGRKILYRTGLLKKSVTIPNFSGSSEAEGSKKSITGKNINRVEGTNLVWGTDLVYAGVHNKGLPAKKIPQREFLKVSDEWMKSINEFVMKKVLQIVKKSIGSTSK